MPDTDDPTTADPAEDAHEVLEEQRAAHEPDVALPVHETNEAGVGPLVNNTGDDGGASSG